MPNSYISPHPLATGQRVAAYRRSVDYCWVDAVKSAWAWIKATIAALFALLGILFLIDRRKRAGHEEAARRDEGEADKVTQAGEAGNTEEVLDSWRKATDDK